MLDLYCEGFKGIWSQHPGESVRSYVRQDPGGTRRNTGPGRWLTLNTVFIPPGSNVSGNPVNKEEILPNELYRRTHLQLKWI